MQRGRGGFSPLSLFAAGEQGAWYDPSDFSTMFQDSAGTTPVTAVEQPVGKILDKSGRGNHATQATAAKRPTLKQDGNGKYYLLFDGVDDALSTGSIDFTAGDRMTVFTGVRKLSDLADDCVFELSAAADVNPGAFYLRASAGGGANYQSLLRGATTGSGPLFSVAAPATTALSMQYNLSAPLHKGRMNAAAVFSVSDPVGGGNFGNYPIYIGLRNNTDLPFNGHLYSLIIRAAQSTDAQIISAEAYVNSKTGAY